MIGNSIIRFTLILILSMVTLTIQAQTLEIKITDIQVNKGKILIAVYNNEKEWLKKPFREMTFQANATSKLIAFDLPHGNYAIAVYQDTNGNNNLDSNFLGIPKEPIAFGNNYKPLGEPKFESASIKFDSNYKIQTLKLYTVF